MESVMEIINNGLQYVKHGEHNRALELFKDLYIKYPTNPDVLYNYGILLNELMNFRESSKILEQLVSINPEYKHAKVALAYSYIQLNELIQAEILLNESLIVDPNNIFLLRNLGTIYAKREDYEEALKIFHAAETIEPENRHILYGIALALFHKKEYTKTSEYLDKIISQSINDEFDELSKTLQRKIAEINFKTNGLRMDAVYYCLDAMEKFDELSFTEIQGIIYEISLLGSVGLDPTDPEKKHQLTSISGFFSALELICIMYVGFQILSPDLDIGFDLSKEYLAATEMFNKQYGS